MRRMRVLAAMLAAGLAGPAGAGVLDAVNAQRGAAGLPALAEDAALTRAAETQAVHMAQTGQLSHAGPRGRGVLPRIRGAGFGACFAAENVAWGQRDLAEVTAGWMRSPGHRRNILDRRATHGGLALAKTADGRPYWALVLAARC
ncbi:CAP domain-containing protein [Jannaschia ovalis]|uniref:CAP domain-containing protein n=1 Tax=Jannaschia ovalis TaxID=3038773 RepID=A0ABY8LEL0_9RHOB|nr:CAP domain-containing protein [Jannaschia sp. GRR-S6-38]WGH79744.1 CAP domain-containing protein [Jannaschia sp. GRR-S6-38]